MLSPVLVLPTSTAYPPIIMEHTKPGTQEAPLRPLLRPNFPNKTTRIKGSPSFHSWSIPISLAKDLVGTLNSLGDSRASPTHRARREP